MAYESHEILNREITQISDERQLTQQEILREISDKLSLILLYLEKITDEKYNITDEEG